MTIYDTAEAVSLSRTDFSMEADPVEDAGLSETLYSASVILPCVNRAKRGNTSLRARRTGQEH